MKASDSGFMEFMADNPHQEAKKIASYSYSSNKYFDRYCAMATLSSSFPPDKWRIILSTKPLFLADLKKPGC